MVNALLNGAYRERKMLLNRFIDLREKKVKL